MKRKINVRGLSLIMLSAVFLLVSFTGCDWLFNGDDDSSLSINSITPAQGIMNDVVNVSVSISATSDNLQLKLINGATIIEASNINIVTGGQVTAQFDLAVSGPMSMDLYATNDSGAEDTSADAFTVNEYEVIQDALGTLATIDISSGDVAYDFSEQADCVLSSTARDVTFILDGSSDPALTITTGGSGGLYYYGTSFPSLEQASDLEAQLSAYAQDGDAALPMSINSGEYYGLFSVGNSNEFVILEVNSVDKTNDTVDINYMIVRLISTS